jgi:hypothetical protein
MADLVPHGKNRTTGQSQPLTSSDMLTDESGNPVAGGYPASYAYFQASTVDGSSPPIIQWSKDMGTSDITVSSGVITINTTGTYLIQATCTTTGASTRDLNIRYPAGGTLQATSTENQASGGGSQVTVTVESITSGDDFDVTLSSGIVASITANHLWVQRVA